MRIPRPFVSGSSTDLFDPVAEQGLITSRTADPTFVYSAGRWRQGSRLLEKESRHWRKFSDQ